MLNQKGNTISGIYLEIYSTNGNASLYKESKNKERNKEKSKKGRRNTFIKHVQEII